jgi:acyl-CoA reductase-like NAD-dependent aldehyde dehydrogenase
VGTIGSTNVRIGTSSGSTEPGIVIASKRASLRQFHACRRTRRCAVPHGKHRVRGLGFRDDRELVLQIPVPPFNTHDDLRTERPHVHKGAHTCRLLIDGKLIPGDDTLDVINFATGQVLAQVASASAGQFEAAVAAAKAAQPRWAATPLETRRAAPLKLATHIDANIPAIARALVQEQGKPLSEAEGEVAYAAVFLLYFAEQELAPETIQDDDEYFIQMHYRPLGVVAGITPWNFPFLIGMYKLGPSVLLGNSFIWKPAPTTPVTALMLAPVLAEIFPAGVVNIVTDKNDLGGVLTSHKDVVKVSFTGSTATGRKIMAAASSLKRLTLELGGNDAGIVLPDADIGKTAQRVVGSAFFNAGQACIALKRLYVHRSIYQEMCAALKEEVGSISVGDGLEQGTRMGPLQNAQQYAKAQHYLDVAAKDGRITSGGEKLDGPGYFIRPTLVADIADGSALVDEEQFAPILPVVVYDDVDEVIARANASEYGLGGSVWSKSVEKAAQVAARMESGTIWINHHTHFGPRIPFAGAKQSGVGSEFGREGLLEFSQRTVVSRAR